MTAPTIATPTYDAFLRILAAHRVGDPISSNALRDQLAAAQIPARALGGCFQRALDNGYLTSSGMTVQSTGHKSRGSRVLVYRLNKRPGVTR